MDECIESSDEDTMAGGGGALEERLALYTTPPRDSRKLLARR